MRLVGLGQCSLDECIFGIHYRRFRIGMQQVLDPLFFLDPGRDDFVPVRERVNDFFNVLVVFQVFDGQVSGGVLVAQRAVLLQQKFYPFNAFFEFSAMIDMYMAGKPGVAVRVYLYDRVEEFMDTCSVAADGRADRHSEKVSELLDVEFVAFRLQLVIHVQCHDDLQVHVNDLCGQIQVPLDVRRVHDIDDDIRHVLYQVFPDI